MGKHCLLFLCLVGMSCVPLLHSYLALAAGTDDGSEQWGYVEVRPKAHLFWWHYKSPHRVEDPTRPWPIILWLQGGPGASGVAFGNFLEIGPLDGNLKPRNSTWLLKADLLFVDSPVATGFSYVEDEALVARSDEEAAADLTALLKELFNGNETLQKSPLYIFGESYGGKFAATLGVSALKAIEAGELKLQLGGVALGDSWISPEDFVIQQQLAEGKYEDATSTWGDLEQDVLSNSNNVDFYNFLLDAVNDPVVGSTAKGSKGFAAVDRYSRYLSTKMYPSSDRIGVRSTVDLYALMNGPIYQKLKIIPENVTWGGQDGLVFQALIGDFMRPRIQEVDELLAKGINVTIYNGQVWQQYRNMGLYRAISLDKITIHFSNSLTNRLREHSGLHR
ncbi:unnamed protein product, partial [Dovyalis caffra]